MAEAINRSWTHWFEIPVSNFDRAKTFYETIYNMKIDSFEAGALKMGIFPHSRAGALKPKNQFLKNTVSWPCS